MHIKLSTLAIISLDSDTCLVLGAWLKYSVMEMGKRHEGTEQLRHRKTHYALRHPQGLA
jgi:hypothetical protein